MKAMWALPVLAVALYGADITGTWTGSIEVSDPSNGEKINTEVKAQFDQKANVLSGKIGRAQDEQPEMIRNGKIDGKTLVFEVQPPEATSPMKFSLVLVSDDRIEGDMKGAIDVGNIQGKVVLSRVK
jgi:hypothetical protein